MNCAEFLTRLESAVEGRTLPQPELRDHAEACHSPACNEAWEEYVLLQSAVSAWQERACGTDGPDCRSHAASTRQRARYWGPVLAAACLLGIISTAWISSPRSSVDPGVQEGLAISIEATQGHEPAVVPELSADWIAGASVQMSHSVTHLLLGADSSGSESASPASGWLQIWPEQLRPAQEDLDVLRSLLWDAQDPQSGRSNLPTGQVWG